MRLIHNDVNSYPIFLSRKLFNPKLSSFRENIAVTQPIAYLSWCYSRQVHGVHFQFQHSLHITRLLRHCKLIVTVKTCSKYNEVDGCENSMTSIKMCCLIQ